MLRENAITLVEPPRRVDGTCAACVGGWLCKYHQQTTALHWNREQNRNAAMMIRVRRDELHRIAARYELESDEFYTAEQKAEAILARRNA